MLASNRLRPTALLIVLLATSAAGHGVPAQTLGINLRVGNDRDLLVSTTFGAVVSHDKGASWREICEEAIGYGTAQRPAYWLSSSGSTFAGSFKGLFVARTDGCDWKAIAAFENTGCSDVQGSGPTMLATSGKFGVENGILRSSDDGASWSPTSAKSSSLFYSAIRFAPSDPQRVYASAWWFQPNSSVLLRSDDNGQSFTSTDLSAGLPAAGAFYVLGVHPTHREILFATVTRDSEPRASWLLKSTDSGATFTPVITADETFNSLAFAADPSTVYAATGNQLFRSTDEGQTFSPLPSPLKNACVTTSGSAVYSCGYQELDGWVVGKGDGGDFSALLRWSTIAGPQSCPKGSAVQSLCEPLWPVVQATFPRESSDGGTPDGGTDAGPIPPQPVKPCGCNLVEGPMALLALVFFRRARRAC